MKREITLYHRRKDGRVKVWSVRQDGCNVYQAWSEEDGKIQTTKHAVKGNERQTALERATHRYEVLVEKRQNKGYVTVRGQVMDTVESGSYVDFDHLPKSFAPAKPNKKVDLNLALQWDKKDLLIVQRKRDGMRYRIVSNTKGKIQVYSSSNEECTDHFSEMLEDVEIPPRTILDAELTVTHVSLLGDQDSDRFDLVSSIARSKADRARKTIRSLDKQGFAVRFYVFDVLWAQGKAVYNRPYVDRYALIAHLVGTEGDEICRMPMVTVSYTRIATLDEAIAISKSRKWEGLVIWRQDQRTIVRLNGSPERINCWKIKFVKEMDVIATGYELGKGKNAKVVGNFNIALRDPHFKSMHHNLVFIPMGNCGGGLDDKTREEALHWKYPCVIQIEYDSMSKKAFRFPVFLRKREDKKVSECYER